MINRWNVAVKPDDIVYHLGDFAFCDHTPYLQQLHGQKHLILGNHDYESRVNKARGWMSVENYRELKLGEDNLVLFHYGMRVWNKCHHGSIHLYGHSHDNLVGDTQCLDVGVDAWMYQPITLESIKKRLSYNPKRFEPDHHQPRTKVA